MTDTRHVPQIKLKAQKINDPAQFGSLQCWKETTVRNYFELFRQQCFHKFLWVMQGPGKVGVPCRVLLSLGGSQSPFFWKCLKKKNRIRRKLPKENTCIHSTQCIPFCQIPFGSKAKFAKIYSRTLAFTPKERKSTCFSLPSPCEETKQRNIQLPASADRCVVRYCLLKENLMAAELPKQLS